jgi:DNA repair protein RecO (recombination protein O)
VTDREEVRFASGYVLHQRPFRNTSQIVDCMTADHGRIALVARGSRRPRPGRRALLQPFVPLHLSWVRRGDLGSLTDVEAAGGAYTLAGDALLAGFYANELLLRLMARGDANRQIFSCYSECLADLASSAPVARSLRLFELRLLSGLGYGLTLDCDAASGAPIEADRSYVFELERGLVAADTVSNGTELHWGRDLISLREERLSDENSLRTARRLLSRVLKTYLGDRPLRSRDVLSDIFHRGLSG